MRSGIPLIVASLLMPVASHTQVCAATPEAAAEGSLVAGKTMPSRAGYRMQDVQVDRLTGQAWIRVRRCDSDSAPTVLVPLRATLADAASLARMNEGVEAGLPSSSNSIFTSAIRQTPLAAVSKVIAVHAGEIVRVVLLSAVVHMELEGVALQQASTGDSIDVMLHRTGYEPGQRIRGTLRADHTVEAQP
jgi:hypothetical protein